MSIGNNCALIFALVATFCCCPGLVLAGQDQTAESALRVNRSEAEIRALNAQLALNPADHAARAGLARLLGQAGRYDEALAEYDTLISAFPHDVDHALARGQVLSWLGRNQESLEELERARALAPDYQAIWKLQLQVMKRLEPGAEEIEALTVEAESRFPETDWRDTKPPADVIHWKLTVGGAYERLSGDIPNWNNQYIQVDWMQSGSQRYFGRIARDSRFDQSDQQFVTGGEWRLDNGWTWGAEINASPSADFQPETGFAVYVERPISKAWVADAAFRQRRYESATVSTYGAALQRYFGDYRVAYGLNLSHLHGFGNSLAHTLAMDWYLTSRDSVRITLSDGDETEAIGAGQVIETPVTSLTLSGRHEFTDRLSLSWWAGTNRQGDLYRRNYVGLAITVGL